jgi:hypothetical protein
MKEETQKMIGWVAIAIVAIAVIWALVSFFNTADAFELPKVLKHKYVNEECKEKEFYPWEQSNGWTLGGCPEVTPTPSPEISPTPEPSPSPSPEPESNGGDGDSDTGLSTQTTDCSDPTLPEDLVQGDCGAVRATPSPTPTPVKVETVTTQQDQPDLSEQFTTFTSTGYSWF